MSLLTVTMRKDGLGGLLDAAEGLGAQATKAIANSPPVQAVETQVIDDAGDNVKAAVVGVITSKFPGAAVITNEVMTPLISGIEAFVLHFLQHGTEATTA